ncbi:unnamed protein product [Allacma fusca]|uniref:Uncharacterized protein n=1 Tax=Allacma fusca TaxID=39272 RepID=A0A8J2LB38_9HEXA|nr:unnamed protein product [Allacma fusca]
MTSDESWKLEDNHVTRGRSIAIVCMRIFQKYQFLTKLQVKGKLPQAWILTGITGTCNSEAKYERLKKD